MNHFYVVCVELSSNSQCPRILVVNIAIETALLSVEERERGEEMTIVWREGENVFMRGCLSDKGNKL